MSEMIRIEQERYKDIEVDEGDVFVDLEQNRVYVRAEKKAIAPLILAILKLNPSSIPEVLKGIEETKK